jgi:hypothetical protein
MSPLVSQELVYELSSSLAEHAGVMGGARMISFYSIKRHHAPHVRTHLGAVRCAFHGQIIIYPSYTST